MIILTIDCSNGCVDNTFMANQPRDMMYSILSNENDWSSTAGNLALSLMFLAVLIKSF